MKNQRNAANAALAILCRAYYDAIPLDALFAVARMVGEPVQEDGTPWSGLLCGREGRAQFELATSRHCLNLQWYKMESGRFEVNAYIS